MALVTVGCWRGLKACMGSSWGGRFLVAGYVRVEHTTLALSSDSSNLVLLCLLEARRVFLGEHCSCLIFYSLSIVTVSDCEDGLVGWTNLWSHLAQLFFSLLKRSTAKQVMQTMLQWEVIHSSLSHKLQLQQGRAGKHFLPVMQWEEPLGACGVSAFKRSSKEAEQLKKQRYT